jgi:hypothetical protein
MFYRLEPEVAGGLGEHTVMDRSVVPPRVERLHYVFEGWLGDDLLETYPSFIVSEQLATRLDGADLGGYRWRPCEVSVSGEFAELQPEVALPTFRWLDVWGKPQVDDFGVEADGRLVVSDRALSALRLGQLEHCDIEELTGTL